MATIAGNLKTIYCNALIDHLHSMAQAVEDSIHKALDALTCRDYPAAAALASEIFMHEPQINEMEVVIDDQAVRLLREGHLPDDEVRLIVATLKITNDLERIADLAVNIAERVISLAEMPAAEPPADLAAMAEAVRAMVRKSLGALIYRNVALASETLESDDAADRYRHERLLAEMTGHPVQEASDFQFDLAARYLERITNHATNIAEDIIFWLVPVNFGASQSRAPHSKPSWPSTSTSPNRIVSGDGSDMLFSAQG